MALPTNPDEDGKPKRPLPPELEFLRQPPPKDLEAEELIAFIKHQHALIRQRAALIRAHGMDPEVLIGFTAGAVVKAEKSCQEADASDEKMFHAMADRADAEYNLFKAMEAIVEQNCAERPFDNDVQEAKEFVDEWRNRMPKQ